MAERESDELKYRIVRLTTIASVCMTLIRGGTAVAIAWLIIDGLIQISTNAPEQIGALAKVVEAIHVNEWLSWCMAAVCGSGWYLERRGKKRAIKEKGRLQKIVEANDPDRTTCGLTETGETPGE